MALCRDTRMGQFFSGPVDPPDFLRDAFPVEEELRCVGHLFCRSVERFVNGLTKLVSSLLHIHSLDDGGARRV